MEKMTKERLEWLRANKPACVTLISNSLKGEKVNVNGCNVKGAKGSFNISHLTEKGYYSKKALFVDFLTLDRIETFEIKRDGKTVERRLVVLTDDEFDYLISHFNEKGKIFQTAEQRARTEKMAGLIALAQRIDIHDRG